MGYVGGQVTEFWPSYSSPLFAEEAVIGMPDWSCCGRDKSKSPIIQDVPDTSGWLATLGTTLE